MGGCEKENFLSNNPKDCSRSYLARNLLTPYYDEKKIDLEGRVDNPVSERNDF